ncbi:MAG: cohesin domain-containing protein [Patescibacteria group bacterium]
MSKKFLALICFLFVSISVPLVAAEAATGLYFKGPIDGVSVGDEFSVEILIDSDQPLNAYSFVLKYPTDNLQVIGFNSANSIIDVQREEPQVFEGGSIKFAGASLKPFSGRGGIISIINFKALRSGNETLNFSEPKVYLADGKGTKVVPGFKSIDIKIGEAVGTIPHKIEFNDIKPPEIVILNLTKDPITSGRKLLSFLIKDDVSGVKEILYREMRWFWWGEFQKAQNPSALPLRTWAVEIKAIDNAGNVTQRTIYDWGALVKSYFLLWFVIVLAAILVINRLIRRKVYNNRSNG